MRVLIVDDDQTSRKLLRVNSEAEGFQVFEAADGVEALETLAREEVDVVVSDVLMPRMDGYRLCYEIRRSDRLRRIGVIFYTGTYTSPNDEKLAYRVCADAFLKKPIRMARMIATIREVASLERDENAQVPDLFQELTVMREYSEGLVSKLEQKNLSLQETREQLLRINRDLIARTEELGRAREELRLTNEDLEQRVRERTLQLEATNRELESFTHAVSHDLRAPLRAIEGFSAILLAECAGEVSEAHLNYLRRIPEAAARMNELIDDLLQLSRVSHLRLRKTRVDLSALANAVVAELRTAEPQRKVEVRIQSGVIVEGDERLLRIALKNLLDNAWKFSRQNPEPIIEFGVTEGEGRVYFVRDNGIGFEMTHADKLFNAFERLHPRREFPGSGIGLSTVRRVVDRHGGRIWAESLPGERTTFYFTL